MRVKMGGEKAKGGIEELEANGDASLVSLTHNIIKQIESGFHRKEN